MNRAQSLLLLLLLSVAGVTHAVPADQPSLLIEHTIEPPAPYIQQQTRYTLRLYRESHLQRGHFVRPEIPGVITKFLDDSPLRYQERNGKHYEVLEQHYLLFPQQSGELEIPPPVFSSRDLFIKGTPLTMRVKPIPGRVNLKHWIVTPGITAIQQWITPEKPWRVGDHIERIISIEAEAVTGAQLPASDVEPTEGLEIQKVSSRVGTTLRVGKLIGHRTDHILYIPEKAGPLSIGALTFEWWDAQQERRSTSELSGMALEILPSTPQSATPPLPTLPATTQPLGGRTLPDRERWSDSIQLPILIVTGIAIFWGILYLILHSQLWHYSLLIRLYIVCHRSDPREVKRLLFLWMKRNESVDQPPNLIALGKSSRDQIIQNALNQLDAALYADGDSPWNNRGQFRTLAGLILSSHRPPTKSIPTALPPLWRR